jgi:pyruvate/2-oxoglutarate dehydrogenase complex dihydrolipoamide dehydrogenase (E3) component
MNTIHTNVLVLGSGTAGSNAARAAVTAGAEKVTIIQPRTLINTCVEEGCMPSKSILAGAHYKETLPEVLTIRDAHIDRLKKALTDSLAEEEFEIVHGMAVFVNNTTVQVTDAETQTMYTSDSIIIATGSHPFVPPIPGLDSLGDRMIISDDVVAKKEHFDTVPKKILTIGGGPIGLELSTFFHDMGSDVQVLQRDKALGLFDSEFGDERVRASMDKGSFPIHLRANLINTTLTDDGVLCTIEKDGDVTEELFDAVLVATGRVSNLSSLAPENTDIEYTDQGAVIYGSTMQTTVANIYIAGDVTGHYQILHFAAEMGRVAGHNAASNDTPIIINYDKLMLAVSFDQFPSALIGLTEKEALSRGIKVITASKQFNSIGIGILKRQEYGLWKVVAEADTGKIIGSQILGPDSAGELIQILVPILANNNTYDDVLAMTWYHPTYSEIIKSIARDLASMRHSLKAGM